MRPIAPSNLIDNLKWRYAVKKFDETKKIPAEAWSALEQSMVLAPSSFGLQPWRFIVVNDPAVRAKLRPASWNQPQITDASHLVVLARQTSMTKADVEHYIKRIMEVRGAPAAALEGYKNMMVGFVEKPAPGFDVNVWTSRQSYIALGFFLEACAMLGVDACPMEGFDAKQYDEILGLNKPSGLGGGRFSASVIAAAGYRASDDSTAAYAKVRFPQSEVVLHV